MPFVALIFFQNTNSVFKIFPGTNKEKSGTTYLNHLSWLSSAELGKTAVPRSTRWGPRPREPHLSPGSRPLLPDKARHLASRPDMSSKSRQTQGTGGGGSPQRSLASRRRCQGPRRRPPCSAISNPVHGGIRKVKEGTRREQ